MNKVFDRFEHPRLYGFRCPICHTWADLPVLLAPIEGTEKDGMVECKEAHVECWELRERMLSVAAIHPPSYTEDYYDDGDDEEAQADAYEGYLTAMEIISEGK